MYRAANPLVRDPEILTAFRDRVDRGEWAAARRLGLALELHRSDPQQLFEGDDAYLRRLADRYAARPRLRAFAQLRNRRGLRTV
jgi:hypothetical protein